MKDAVFEGVDEEREVLCLVGGAEGHGGEETGGKHEAESRSAKKLVCDWCDTAVTAGELQLHRLRQRAPSPRSSSLPQSLPTSSSDKLPRQRGTLLYISP